MTPWSEPVQPSHTRCEPSRAGNQTLLKKATAQSETQRKGKERKGKERKGKYNKLSNLMQGLGQRWFILWLIESSLLQLLWVSISWFFFPSSAFQVNKKNGGAAQETKEKEKQWTYMMINFVFVFFLSLRQNSFNNREATPAADPRRSLIL